MHRLPSKIRTHVCLEFQTPVPHMSHRHGVAGTVMCCPILTADMRPADSLFMAVSV